MPSKRSQENSIEMSLMNPREQWKNIFDKYNIGRNEQIYINELDDLIESQEHEQDMPDHVVAKLHNLADISNEGQLDSNEIATLRKHPAVEPLIGRAVNRYVHIFAPKPVKPVKPVKYEDEFTCCPPPVFMIIISIIQIIVYCADAGNRSTKSGIGPIATFFIYDPKRRYEAWRYITYMFVHIGVMHLVVNMCVQVMLGIPLEMVHRWWRVLVLYLAGVIAGSLATSITDPRVMLAGSTGGVYALITAHIATIALNWREMEYAFIQLAIFLIITGCDIGGAIYDRYARDVNKQTAYAAHFAGAMAGLLLGMNVLRNINVTRTDRVIWWVSIITYVVLMGIAIVWNAAYPDYFPPQA